jgi:hypothetical protein
MLMRDMVVYILYMDVSSVALLIRLKGSEAMAETISTLKLDRYKNLNIEVFRCDVLPNEAFRVHR